MILYFQLFASDFTPARVPSERGSTCSTASRVVKDNSLSAIEIQVFKLSKEMPILKADLANKELFLREALRAKEESLAEIAVLKKRIDEVTTRATSSERDATSLRKQLEELRRVKDSELPEAIARTVSAGENLSRVQEQLAQLQKSQEEKDTELCAMRDGFAAMRKRAEGAEKAAADLNAQIESLQKQLEAEKSAKEAALKANISVSPQRATTAVNIPMQQTVVVQQNRFMAYLTYVTHFFTFLIGLIFGKTVA